MSFPLPRGASLSALANAYGGECYAGGRRALLPAPGHSADDRSISLLLQGGRVVAHGFGAFDWREVLDDLRQRGWIDAENRLLAGGAPVETGPGAPPPTRVERRAAAQRLWDGASLPEARSAAGLYIALRGVDLGLATAAGALRAHGAAAAAVYRDRGPRRPALLAAVRDPDGDLTAVEVTYLDRSGRRCAAARPPRKLIGVLPRGSAVRLARAEPDLLVGEGVFTTLSAMRRFGRPGWALLSTSNLRGWSAPDGVRSVLIAGDRGPDGERSAGLLHARLENAGVSARVVLPPEGAGDWNDLDQEEAKEGRDGAPGG